MKRTVILGHFAFGQDKSNGQTIKTKIVANALKQAIGSAEVDCEDTMGGWHFLLRLPFVCLRMLHSYRNIIFLPAYKGVRVIVPLLVLMNIFYHRRLHYVVIGGWLPKYVRRYPLLRFMTKRIDHIYVETEYMKTSFDALGYNNVKVMANFKPLNIIHRHKLSSEINRPYRLCTFSRVMQEKGIEDAIAATLETNQRLGAQAFTLDIFGMIEPGREPWFEALMHGQPKEIHYGGIIPFAQSTDVLCKYFSLLFPTRFKTEGFAGTLIDAMAAGLPVIASDCPSNKELIKNGETGLLYEMNNVEALTDILIDIASAPERMLQMRPKCVEEAVRYRPENIIKILTDELL